MTTTPDTPERAAQTAEDTFLSMTGFDELGVVQAFGVAVEKLKDTGLMFLRAMVFVDRKHAGDNHDAARQAALGMSIRDLQGYFPEPVPELDPADPETDEGKDGTPSR